MHYAMKPSHDVVPLLEHLRKHSGVSSVYEVIVGENTYREPYEVLQEPSTFGSLFDRELEYVSGFDGLPPLAIVTETHNNLHSLVKIVRELAGCLRVP